MIESLTAYLIGNYPTITFVVVLVLTVTYVALRIQKYHFGIIDTKNKCNDIQGEMPTIKQDLTHTKQRCDDMHDKQIPEIHKKMDTIGQKLDNVVMSLNTLGALLVEKKTIANNPFVVNSPIELSEIGNEVLVKIGGKKYIDAYLDKLIVNMEAQGFKSGFDVQEYAKTLLLTNSLSDEFVEIRNYIYQNPVHKTADGELSLILPMCIQIMGIYLRNKYFEKHPTLNTDL